MATGVSVAPICGPGLQTVVGFAGAGNPASGCDLIDPSAVAGDVVLQFALDDTADVVVGFRYSIDGGASFTEAADFDIEPGTPDVFPFLPFTALAVVAEVPEPTALALLGCAGLAAAVRRSARVVSRRGS